MAAARRMRRAVATRPDERWSMGFVSDAPSDGRRIRALTLDDDRTREALTIGVDGRTRGEHVAEELERVAALRGPPRRIRAGDGPDSVSWRLDHWADGRGVTQGFIFADRAALACSRAGESTNNAHAEAFEPGFERSA